MLINSGTHSIIHITQNALEIIEMGGRTAYHSEDKTTKASAEKFIKMIITRGHESVLEHASIEIKKCEGEKYTILGQYKSGNLIQFINYSDLTDDE